MTCVYGNKSFPMYEKIRKNMAKQIAPITVAQISAFKKENPNDKTDFSTVIPIITTGKGLFPCPCCTDGKVSNGILLDGSECHICDGYGLVSDLSKIAKTTIFSKKK